MMERQNAKSVSVNPESHLQFMSFFGWKDGFWQGWQDALANQGFRADYECADFLWQWHYENGREFVIRLQAKKFKPYRWPNRYKPGPHLWRSLQPICDGRA